MLAQLSLGAQAPKLLLSAFPFLPLLAKRLLQPPLSVFCPGTWG